VGAETISAIITSRNSRNYILSCVAALLEQTRPVDEILLVDRGSTDETLDLVRTQFPSVRVVHSHRDLGTARSLNEGIRRTSGDFLLLLSPEVQISTCYVEELLSKVHAQGQAADRVGSASGKMFKMFRGPSILESAGLEFDHDRATPAKRGEGASGNGSFEKEEYVFGAAPGASLYRRRTIEDIAVDREYLDENFSRGVDEFDLAWRTQLRGWRSLYVPTATAHADLRASPPWLTADHIHGSRDRYLHIFKNLGYGDVDNRFLGFVLQELSDTARNLVFAPQLLLSLPLSVMKMPLVRIKRQIVRKGRRVKRSRLGALGFRRAR
jgi:GT2 family glycosyltransferase